MRYHFYNCCYTSRYSVDCDFVNFFSHASTSTLHNFRHSTKDRGTVSDFILQVYTEGMYLVKVSSKVLNDTLIFNQHLSSMMPENWENQLDSAFENAYVYGRDVISKMVR